MSLLDIIVREAWLWLGASLLLALLWSNLTWLFSPWADAVGSSETSGSLAERIVFQVAHWRFSGSVHQGLRLLYYVGLPAVALFWGRDAVLSRLLGLQRLALPSPGEGTSTAALSANWADWIHDLGWAAVLGLAGTGLLLLASMAYHRALFSIKSTGRTGRTGGWRLAREAIYHEVHWAFYRNAPVMAFGLYWGTWAALALIALEAALNPEWRGDLVEPARAWPCLVQGAIAVVSCLVYMQTQNLWLAVLLHWGIEWTLQSVTRPSPTASDVASCGE